MLVQRGPLAQPAGPQGRGALRRPHRSAGRERPKPAGEGLAKAGNARVRHGMIQLAWRHLLLPEGERAGEWYRERTADARGGTRKTMIVALARKLLIALWRLVTTGEAPAGLRPSSSRVTSLPARQARLSFGVRSRIGAELPMTIRGGGNPTLHMVFEPRFRMGPPPRSFAADAHDCIMVRILTDRPNTSLWRDGSRLMASSPRSS